MRILASLYLMLVGFITVVVLEDAIVANQLLAGEAVARALTYALFFSGLFHILPQAWRWFADQTPLRKASQAAWGVLSGFTGLAGLALAVLSVLPSSESGGFLWGAALLLLSVAGALLTAASIQLRDLALVMRAAHARDRAEAAQADISNQVLRLARAHQGRLTALEVAASSSLHHKQAKACLQELADEGFCEARVAPSGTVFYLFHEFADSSAKRDILEEPGGSEAVLDFEQADAAHNATTEAQAASAGRKR